MSSRYRLKCSKAFKDLGTFLGPGGFLCSRSRSTASTLTVGSDERSPASAKHNRRRLAESGKEIRQILPESSKHPGERNDYIQARTAR